VELLIFVLGAAGAWHSIRSTARASFAALGKTSHLIPFEFQETLRMIFSSMFHCIPYVMKLSNKTIHFTRMTS
jgi:hypothetical protein